MPLCLPLLLLWTAAAADPSKVDIAGSTALDLRRAAAADDDAPTGVRVAQRVVDIRPGPQGLTIHVRWILRSLQPSWFEGLLASDTVQIHRIRVDGRPAGAGRPEAPRRILVRVHGEAVVELDGLLVGDPSRSVDFELLPAVRGQVRTPPQLWAVPGDDSPVAPRGVLWSGHQALRVAPRPTASTDLTLPLVLGRVATGLTIGEAEIRGHARMFWVLRRGEIQRVSFIARGLGADLQVKGPQVLQVERRGDRVDVQLRGPEDRRVALDLQWTQPTPKGEASLPVPVLEPLDVMRTESVVEVGRDGDLDVAPAFDGWQALAPQQLPDWGRDLVEGARTAAFSHPGHTPPARLELLPFVPVPGPAVVVDKAQFDLVTEAGGRALLRARYELSNERAPRLDVTLPPGARLLAVEMAGAPVAVVRLGDIVRIPIKRSLETVAGLMGVVVVVTAVIEQAPWACRDLRPMPLPQVDAPVRTAQVRVALPRTYRARMDPGDDGVVAVRRWPARPRRRLWTKQASSQAAHPDEVNPALAQAEADRLLQDAVEAYNRNDLAGAQARLTELQSRRGDRNDDAERLQSNLDLLTGSSAAGSEEPPAAMPSEPASAPLGKPASIGRRIRAQAKARAKDQVADQRARRERAKQLRAEGKYDAAQAELEAAQETNAELRRYEGDATAYDHDDQEIAAELEATKSEAETREQLEQAEHGLGAPHLDAAMARRFAAAFASPRANAGFAPLAGPGDPTDPRPVPQASAATGPAVILPSAQADVIEYAFSLWAPNARPNLVIRSRRPIRLAPRTKPRMK